MNVLLTPHGDKLNALLNNQKLPKHDMPRILEAKSRYETWLKELRSVDGDYIDIVTGMVRILKDSFNLLFSREISPKASY